MHLVSEVAGAQAKVAAADKPPFGPGFTPDEATKTEKLQVWGSSFSDPGGDFCKFVAFDAAGQVVGTKIVGGY